MSRRKKTDGVQDALIPDEMSPLKLLDFNAGNAKIKQAAVDLRRSVNTAKPMSSKTEYLAKFQHIDAVTEAIFDVDVLAQHIVDCAEAMWKYRTMSDMPDPDKSHLLSSERESLYLNL